MRGIILTFVIITSISLNSKAQKKDMTLKQAHEKL